MSREEYESYLLTEVQWWLYFNTASPDVDFSTDLTEEDILALKESIPCYHGDVFGVHTIIEVRDLDEMAERHKVEAPNCFVGG